MRSSRNLSARPLPLESSIAETESTGAAAGSAIAASTSAASATLLVIGPMWSSDHESGTTPFALTRP